MVFEAELGLIDGKPCCGSLTRLERASVTAMYVSTTEVSVPEARAIEVTDDTLTAELSDGRTISAPLAGIPAWCTQRWRRGAGGN